VNKKYLFVILLGFILLTVVLVFIRSDEDTWLCQNNQWVKHGNPSASRPVEGCGQEPVKTQMANPASVYCTEQGGKSEIRTQNDGSQTGWCVFQDRECDEWEFFRTKNCQ
jgi:uncharacterized protein